MTQQLSMFDKKPVAGVQNKIVGAKFPQDAQPTREIKWHEEGYVICRYVCKPDTGHKEAVTEDKRTVVIREQVLEVTEFYEVDELMGKQLIEDGHEVAQAIIAERYSVEVNPGAIAS